MKFNFESPQRKEKAKPDILWIIGKSLEAGSEPVDENDLEQKLSVKETKDKYYLDDAFKLLQTGDPLLMRELEGLRQGGILDGNEVKVLTVVLSVASELGYRVSGLRQLIEEGKAESGANIEIDMIAAPDNVKAVLKNAVGKMADAASK